MLQQCVQAFRPFHMRIPWPRATTLARKGVSVMCKIWCISFPENIHTRCKEIGNPKQREFQEGFEGAQTKEPSVGGEWIFIGTAIIDIYFFLCYLISLALCDVVVNRQIRQTGSCDCPLDREKLVRNEVSLQIILLKGTIYTPKSVGTTEDWRLKDWKFWSVELK